MINYYSVMLCIHHAGVLYWVEGAVVVWCALLDAHKPSHLLLVYGELTKLEHLGSGRLLGYGLVLLKQSLLIHVLLNR